MQLHQIIDVDAFVSEVEEPIDDIMDAMRTQTSRMAFYSMKKAEARRQRDKVGLIIKAVEAQLTKTCRAQLVTAANKLAEEENTKPERITADMVKAEVALHADMRKWLEVQLEAEEIYSVCMAAYETFRTRSDMIQSLGHMTRAQMQTGLVIESAKKTASSYKARRAEREARRAEEEQG